jgi:hypothetical protein
VRGLHEPSHRHTLHYRTLTQALEPSQHPARKPSTSPPHAQTIIECLKMGCTGELPPHCKNGQAFIHDPKILAKQEVKAQIKLKFFGLTAQPVVCTRSFSLTQKATKMEYKAFEAALQTVDSSGAKQSLSYKCADLNRLVPELMGVSPAVLENVIFVHQVLSPPPTPTPPHPAPIHVAPPPPRSRSAPSPGPAPAPVRRGTAQRAGAQSYVPRAAGGVC